jgi:hypothetical protein
MSFPGSEPHILTPPSPVAERGAKRKGANCFAPFDEPLRPADYWPSEPLDPAGVAAVLTRVTSKISVALGGIGGCGSAP